MPDSDAEQAPISPEPEITTPHETPAEEPAPMLDVHPPHEAAHSWRDFFIHIATITVGLLIAISLEQSVEAIHHRHQRFELERDLRVEARKNLHLIDLDDKFYEDKTARLNALRQYVDDLSERRNRKLPPPPQAPPDLGSPIFSFPITSVWSTAKESTYTALLPREEAAMFEEVYFENDRMRIFADLYFNAIARQRRFAARFKKQYDPKAPLIVGADAASLAGMNLEELKQYSGLISDAIDGLQE